jgi:Mn-dependent DtxR family transcriptional regulator
MRGEQMEELREAHLRYLLTIYEISLVTPDVSSASIAEQLNVRKPTVSAMLTCLMEKNLLIKQRYGKVYLTDEGFLSARNIYENVIFLMELFEQRRLPMTPQQSHEAAVAASLAVPGISFRRNAISETEDGK